MRLAVIALAALGFASAGAAFAQDQVSDTAFMQANRCKGLALGLGMDAAGLKTFVRQQSRSRADMIIYRGQGLASQAQREAADPAKKEKLAAEYTSACAAFGGTGGGNVAGGDDTRSTIRR
jgi:hypothetical protein